MQPMLQELVDYASKREGETCIENICVGKPSCELVFRKIVDGSSTDVESVVALHTHPHADGIPQEEHR